MERRGPAICNASNIGEGKDEMTKSSIDVQDLRRRIYVEVAPFQWTVCQLAVYVLVMAACMSAS